MNDRELEARIREAFDGIEVPEEAKHRTLAAIEQLRSESDAAAGNPSVPTDAPGRILPFPKRRRRLHMGLGLGAAAACLMAICVLFGPKPVEAIPTAYVDIDINPSIELQIDCNDKVIGAEAYNEDGRRALSQVDLGGLGYSEALATLAADNALGPYLGPDAYVQFSIVADDRGQEDTLTRLSEEYLASLPSRGSCHAFSTEVHNEAHAHGMGCGRYAAMSELMALDPSVSEDECEGMSMRELRDRLEACRSDLDGTESEGAQGTGAGGRGLQGTGNGNQGQGRHGHGGGHHNGW